MSAVGLVSSRLSILCMNFISGARCPACGYWIKAPLSVSASICSIHALLQVGNLSAHQELVYAVLKLADSYLIFAPDLILPSPTLPTLLKWCVHTLAVKEREPLKAALSFLAHILNPTKKQSKSPEHLQHKTGIDGYISSSGKLIMERLVWSACDSCPRHLLKKVADILYDLVGNSEYGEASGQWLVQVLSDPRLLAMHEKTLSREDCERFCMLVLRKPRLARSRFEALVVDFVNIPRGEGTADALVGYEL